MPLYVRSANAIFSEVDGEFVALNIDRGQCYGMDSIASRVWGLIEQPRSLEQICAALEDVYDVDPKVCQADVAALLAALSKEELIRVE